ncbi:hypothetical protein B9Z55_017612 [Caenorhabditis nigoni]|uniref:Uncharacterized protein n=1 Tax=Caenorhabditis nigoni TaxID=1611254 RepID=A0A2G5TAC7_9PELO|nr:hypothetical protein B9Z55_017612 [Caenorhabditis nigoni]
MMIKRKALESQLELRLEERQRHADDNYPRCDKPAEQASKPNPPSTEVDYEPTENHRAYPKEQKEHRIHLSPAEKRKSRRPRLASTILTEQCVAHDRKRHSKVSKNIRLDSLRVNGRRFFEPIKYPRQQSHVAAKKDNSLESCGVKTPSHVTGRSPAEGGRSFWYKAPNRGWKSSRNGHEASQGRSRDALGKPKSIEEAPTKFKNRRIAKDAKRRRRHEDISSSLLTEKKHRHTTAAKQTNQHLQSVKNLRTKSMEQLQKVNPIGEGSQASLLMQTIPIEHYDSPSSRSPDDVPSKSKGPKDITITSTDWQKEFQRTLEFQNQRHSVSMQSPRGGDQANGSDTPVTSSAKLNRQLKVSRQFQSSKLLPRGEVLSSSAVWACKA